MRYQLHDYEIDSVTLENGRIIFSFPDGFYVEDDNGQPLSPLKKELVFIIDTDNRPEIPMESFIFIRRINWSRNGWKDISFKQFSALFKKGNMIIHDEYDSKLTNWKMIKLNANTRRSNIELNITDIIDIAFLD